MNDLEEILREVCCYGDLEKLKVLLHSGISVNINSQNKINGWTALHWAAKRNHHSIVEHLLENGADTSILTLNGESASDICTDIRIKHMLGGGQEGNCTNTTSSEFVPNYIRNPEFPYNESTAQFAQRLGVKNESINSSSAKTHVSNKSGKSEDDNSLVLKFRVAESLEQDFIEIEFTQEEVNFSTLVDKCLTEFNIEGDKLNKIRKLPNTVVRNDRDVTRLKEFQEMEIVLKKMT